MTDIRKDRVLSPEGYSLLLLKKPIEKRNEYGWIKVQTKRDNLREDYYIDVLGGYGKDDEVHFHKGFNLDMTDRFTENRGVMNMETKVVLHGTSGKILTESKTVHRANQVGKNQFLVMTETIKKRRIVRIVGVILIPAGDDIVPYLARYSRRFERFQRKNARHIAY